MARAFACAALLALAAPARARTADSAWPVRPNPLERGNAADRWLARIEDQYLEMRLAERPDLATALGDHRADARLEPIGEHALVAARQQNVIFQQRLDSIPRAKLSAAGAVERDLLAARLAAERTSLDAVRSWQRDPAAYLALAGRSIEDLLQRGTPSLCERSRALARRLAQMPEVLRGARVNLRDPPALLLEDARPEYERLLRLYRSAVPLVATECRDERVQADLAQADTTAVRAAADFLDYMNVDLAPRAHGAGALGEAATRRWLADVAGEGASPESLIARGQRERAWLESRIDSVVARITPAHSLDAALDSLRAGAPAADSLPAQFESALREIRAFIATHPLVSAPATERIQVRFTPDVLRGGRLVGLEAPGPRDPVTAKAWLDVTPPESLWTEERRRTHLGALDPWSARIQVMREVFPGRYLQSIAWRGATTRLRQVFAPPTVTEGWARYAEQIMLEHGFGGGDPRLTLAWLLETRRDVARATAALAFHAGRMSYDEAAALLAGAWPGAPDEARHEARRMIAGFAGVAPALGRWQILDVRAGIGAPLVERFGERAFHDALLREGGLPVPLAGSVLAAAMAPESRAGLSR